MRDEVKAICQWPIADSEAEKAPLRRSQRPQGASSSRREANSTSSSRRSRIKCGMRVGVQDEDGGTVVRSGGTGFVFLKKIINRHFFVPTGSRKFQMANSLLKVPL